jgi:hypothetical protein
MDRVISPLFALGLLTTAAACGHSADKKPEGQEEAIAEIEKLGQDLASMLRQVADLGAAAAGFGEDQDRVGHVVTASLACERGTARRICPLHPPESTVPLRKRQAAVRHWAACLPGAWREALQACVHEVRDLQRDLPRLVDGDGALFHCRVRLHRH